MKQIKNLNILLLLTLLYISVSCTNGSLQMEKLSQIDSLLDKSPQAAYDSLCKDSASMVNCGSTKVRMKYLMLQAKVANKLAYSMPSDSLFKEVVDYYDGNGSANEKMEAHYLLGCIFRDRQEAPMAIQCYKEAVECADTLSQDCDYTTLFSIYGQMADVYRYQYLQKEVLRCNQKYSYYASRAKNIVCSIQGIENMARAYYALGDTLKTIKLAKKANMLYKKYGMNKYAAQVFSTPIYAYLECGQYPQARYYMDIYEKESGLFDKNANIEIGREHYYKAKGKYCLGINQIDSAEYYYRKLGRYGFRYETAQGLLAVYSVRLNSDSVKKYSMLSEREMDNILNGTQAKATVLANSLYNYSKLQKQIDEEKLLHERNKYILIFVGFVILLGLVCLVRRFKKTWKRMAEKLLETNKDYMQTQANLQKYKDKYDGIDNLDKKKDLMETDIFQKFKEMAKPKKGHKIPQVEDWKELYRSFKKHLPVLYEKMKSSKLSAQEFQVCMLTYLDMGNPSIAVLIDTSPNTITNAKQKANRKLFEDKRASSLYDNLLKF